jgi:hypothetical protein
MAEENASSRNDDPGLRRMLKWVAVAFVATVAFAILVVEIMMRWFNQSP